MDPKFDAESGMEKSIPSKIVGVTIQHQPVEIIPLTFNTDNYLIPVLHESSSNFEMRPVSSSNL